MKLSSNPFFILRLSCSAGRREIVAATEELSFMFDPDVCSTAQNNLINLRKRLTAEFGWFPEIDNNAILKILKKVENGELLSTDSLTQLSKLNATLYNFSVSKESDPFEIGYSILDIDEQYSALNTDEIIATINKNRQIAKVATVQEKDIAEEINKKRDYIRQTITERLSAIDQDSYVELVTMLAEKCIADEDYEDGVVLGDVVDQYEVRMQSQLEKSTYEIESHIDRIQQLADDEAISENIASLIRCVQKWDKLAQPLQLKSQASGMPHEISEHLGQQLRDLALYLHNEKDKTEEALTLVNAMKDVFAELFGLADLFNSDSEVLKEMLQGEKEVKALLAELDAVQKQGELLKTFVTTTSVDSFVDSVRKLDAKLKIINLDADTRTKIRETLCYMARSVAIDLHNTYQKTSEALTIEKALASEFADMPSLALKLSQDVAALNQQLVLSLGGCSYSAPSRSSSSNRGSLIAIGIIVSIISICLIISSIASSSSKSSTNTSKSSSSYSQNSGSNSGSYSNGNKSSATTPEFSTPNNSELDELRKEIDDMEDDLNSLSSDIDDYESQLNSLKDDIDYYESQYYETGSDFYYNSYYSAVDEYNDIYEDYSDTIDKYNTLYDKYSSAIESYNEK